MMHSSVQIMIALEIEQLKKTYAGGFEALKGVSLQVEQGDFYALLGPNGAGKSTTIGIITSLVNKTSGKVSVFGHDIDKELELAKQQLGWCHKSSTLTSSRPLSRLFFSKQGITVWLRMWRSSARKSTSLS